MRPYSRTQIQYTFKKQTKGYLLPLIRFMNSSLVFA